MAWGVERGAERHSYLFQVWYFQSSLSWSPVLSFVLIVYLFPSAVEIRGSRRPLYRQNHTRKLVPDPTVHRISRHNRRPSIPSPTQ